MRSIIYTSLLILAAPAFAEPPEGCFGRVYSDGHLAKQPAQVVREILISLDPTFEAGTSWMNVSVTAANQGHAGRAGQGGGNFVQIARCFEDARAKAGWSCAVECDGGIMRLDRLDGQGILVRMEHFFMGTGDECGGELDLAEVPGQTVTYKLDRLPGAECAGQW